MPALMMTFVTLSRIEREETNDSGWSDLIDFADFSVK